MVNLITLIIGILILSSVCQSLWGALSFVNAPYKNVFIIIIIIIIIIIFYYYYYFILFFSNSWKKLLNFRGWQFF